ncbi:MAG: beta-ketoacyl-ACP synthase II [Candidatus Calescibacterium sp.]|nr:beta-ketoacyl-ACP synthase II [Candidatus Calescibacterium sp.]MCX7971718.1 beta-ketoacyl-ACP synthase II [bacterium]MDW8195324.1 beta-ketoacyl-ACP synthase II [Candidatus Calescibacterium sp.]
MKRVVVTGLGILSPIGNSIDEFWKNAVEGKNGISHNDRIDTTEFQAKLAGLVKNFNPLDYIDKKHIRKMDRFVQMGIATVEQALRDSLINLSDLDRYRIGVFAGSGIGGIETFEEQLRVMIEKGKDKVSAYFVPKMIANILSGWIGIIYDIRGPNLTYVSACSSSLHALGEAYLAIKGGIVDVAIVCGSEAPIVPSAIAGFENMGALSKNNDPSTASRPFDLNRDGFVIAEGAGTMILESLEYATKRNSKIYAEIVGYSHTCDAYHITAPDPEAKSIIHAILKAIQNIDPEEVDYINAHGTSTPYNDKTETFAIKKALGNRAYKVNISSIKSMIGHTLGAAGIIESIATVLSIKNQTIPPTINYSTPDPECDLNYTPNKAVKREINVAIKNSFGFGGHNVVVAFKKFDL